MPPLLWTCMQAFDDWAATPTTCEDAQSCLAQHLRSCDPAGLPGEVK